MKLATTDQYKSYALSTICPKLIAQLKIAMDFQDSKRKFTLSQYYTYKKVNSLIGKKVKKQGLQTFPITFTIRTDSHDFYTKVCEYSQIAKCKGLQAEPSSPDPQSKWTCASFKN